MAASQTLKSETISTPRTELNHRWIVRLDSPVPQPHTRESVKLAVFLVTDLGEERFEQSWDELMGLSVPALVTLGERQVLLRWRDVEELDEQGWSILLEYGYWPTVWREPGK